MNPNGPYCSLYITTFSDSWHNNILGYAYRENGGAWEVMDFRGEWVKASAPADAIEEGIKNGALRKIN